MYPRKLGTRKHPTGAALSRAAARAGRRDDAHIYETKIEEVLERDMYYHPGEQTTHPVGYRSKRCNMSTRGETFVEIVVEASRGHGEGHPPSVPQV